MNFLRSLICAVLLVASSAVQGAEFYAKVVAVLDGDTVLALRNNRTVKVRLAEIDAPEKAQPFGETSRRSLSDMVLGKQVKISSQAVDQYGRMIAHLDLNGLGVNAEQIRRGMAWEYSHFHGNKALVALQEEAKGVPRGLWALSNPIPPWEWRKSHPGTFGDQPRATGLPRAAPAAAALSGAACGSKKHCSEMVSCEEARRYLTQCGIKTLDGNGDGMPCESLCGSGK